MMKIEVINDQNRRERYRFNVRQYDSLCMGHDALFMHSLYSSIHVRYDLEEPDMAQLTVSDELTLLYLDEADFRAFRKELNENGVQTEKFTVEVEEDEEE